MPNPHPPILLPLFSLVSDGDYYESYVRWSGLLVLVAASCAFIAYRLSGDLESAIHSVLFYPVLVSITQGQVSMFLLLTLLIFTLLITKRQDVLAGLALSLTVVKPQLALFLAVPLLFSSKRAFLAFCIGGSVLTAFSFALIGIEGFRSIVETLMNMLRGQEPGTNPLNMYGIRGVAARAGLSQGWAWASYVAGLTLVAVLWRKQGLLIPSIAIGTVLATFSSPHLYLHDVSLLAVPLLVIHPLAPVLASLIMLVSFAIGLPFAGAFLVGALIILRFSWGLRRTDTQREVVVLNE